MNARVRLAAFALRRRARREQPSISTTPYVFAEADVVRTFLELDGPASVELGARVVAGRGIIERIAAGATPDVARLALEGLVPQATTLGRSLLELETQSAPFVLALPLTACSVALLAWLRARTGRTLAIESTTLSNPLRRALVESAGPAAVAFESAADLVRRNKGRTAGERLTLVTFPDHHQGARSATRDVRFLGETHAFGLLEPLLHFRGATPIVSLAAAEKSTGALQLERFAWTDPGTGPAEDDALAIVMWLVRAMESVLRAAPATALSFAAMAQRSTRALEIRAALDRRLVEAFLRTWHADPTADRLDDDLYAWALADLAGTA